MNRKYRIYMDGNGWWHVEHRRWWGGWARTSREHYATAKAARDVAKGPQWAKEYVANHARRARERHNVEYL